jgi:peptide/nickel transport system ATP-binding protein
MACAMRSTRGSVDDGREILALSERLPLESSGADEAAPASEPEPLADSIAAPPAGASDVVLDIRDLKTYFFTYDGVVKALDGVTLQVRRGQTTGLVGETGCGKSVTAFSVTRLIGDPPGRVISGKVLFKDADLLWALDKEAGFTLSTRRQVRRLVSTIVASTGQLSSSLGGSPDAQSHLTEIRDAVDRLQKTFVGSDPEILSQVARMQANVERLSPIAGPEAGALATLRTAVARLPGAYASGRVKVRRRFRRIQAANERLSAIRGRGISMIFQEPTQAMNPVFSVANQLGEVLLLHRGTRIIDDMLAVDTNAPDLGPALEALLAAAAEGNRSATAAAADRLGELVHSPSFGTQAYYQVRDLGSLAREATPDVRRALRRRRLSESQKRYLRHRRRLIEIHRQIDGEHVGEMRDGKPHGMAIRRLKFRERAERWSHFYYGLWGLRSRIQRPLNEELFWRVVKQLEGVSIANPAQIAKGYPHELSGGMLQRVMIAMALSPEPDMLIADEPTTALDVTIQAQILELMRDLKTRVGTAILLITHDLAVIAEVADRVCVMYAGNIVEQGPVADLFRRPLHPYAQGLLASIPRMDQPEKELKSIPGSVPDLIHPPTGCRFHPRCPYAMPVCKEARPPMTLEGPDHAVACYLYKGPVVAD